METVCDVKGLQVKGFCEMIDAFNAGGITKVREVCESGDKFYWQITSNGCITGRNNGELILYLPYKSELEEIKHAAMNFDGPDPGRFKWIAYADDEELPYLVDGGHYKNLNFLSFPIPAKDRISLHAKVEEAGAELTPFKSIMISEEQVTF
jgi:hypothetical protein